MLKSLKKSLKIKELMLIVLQKQKGISILFIKIKIKIKKRDELIVKKDHHVKIS